MENFIQESHYFVKILFAALCGIFIGFERKTRYKEAGVRTHSLVCAGSALFAILSKYGFGDTTDSSRIAAQVVTGIGFLGAGIIIYRKQVLRGLTTAAGVWMTSAIGMAAGTGMYYLAGLSTILIIAIHYVLSLPIAIFRTKRFYGLKIDFACPDNQHTVLKEIFNAARFSSIEYKKDGESYQATAEIYTQEFTDDERLFSIIKENPWITSIRRILE